MRSIVPYMYSFVSLLCVQLLVNSNGPSIFAIRIIVNGNTGNDIPSIC